MIQFGKVYWISCVILLISNACNSQQSQKNINVINDDFNAVGLVYHRFGDNRYPSTNTSITDFEEQLVYLKNHNYNTYTVQQLLSGQIDSIKSSVFITVDDGFLSFYKSAFPILKKYNFKATVFINTESVGWSDYMNWDQIKELVQAGIQIGSHSHSHPYFLNIKEEDRSKFFIEDLDKSEKLFLDHLGFVPKIYVYPYGEFDNSMEDILKERGYKVAFAQNSGVWDGHSNLYAIPRFPASGSHFGMDKFEQRIAMKSLPIKTQEQGPIQLSAGKEYFLELKLDEFYNFSSLNCFFNNQYRSDLFSYKEGIITVNLKMPVNTRRALLTFTSKSKSGDWYWWSVLFVNPNYIN